MVRVYKKTPGTRNYQNYSQESLQLAVAAYRRRDGSLMAMSERFGIPMTTIYRKSKGMNKKKVGGQTILSQTEERALCKALFIAADWGFPLQPHFTLYVTLLAGSKPGIWPFNTLAFGDDDFAACEIYQTQDTLSQENPTTSGGTNIHLENADEQDKPSASNQFLIRFHQFVFVIKLTSEKKSDENIPSVSESSVISQVEMDCEDDRQSDMDRSTDESIDALTPSKKESAINKNSLKNGVAK
ncbi:hypothetical protein JTB14_020465 [Gonioctena quinquepunctata]|nr:hypothetical protein JTB14_020465 [Gonioctena quinquepunctata]